MTASRIPAIFVAHGSPMLALDEQAGALYRAWGKALPQPRALLVISAHWEADGLELGEIRRHDELIYDFHGFPAALYGLQYPAPGAPELAAQVATLIGDSTPLRATTRGLDHGVWVPLLRMWPAADIPVLQLALPRAFDDRALFALGRRLAPLREQGVIVVGSGVLTHNLREAFSGQHTVTPDWVRQFDDWVAQQSAVPEQLVDWRTRAPHAARNHPTPEHYLPLLVVAGAAGDDAVSFPITGFEYGVLTRRCLQFG